MRGHELAHDDARLWTRGQCALLACAVLAAAAGLWLTRANSGDQHDPAALSAPSRIDVNQATVAQLVALPNIGPTRAAAIVAERARGPFHSIEDLRKRVTGIGPTTAAKLDPYLIFSGDDGEHE